MNLANLPAEIPLLFGSEHEHRWGCRASSCRAQIITNSEVLFPTDSARFLIRPRSAGFLQ